MWFFLGGFLFFCLGRGFDLIDARTKEWNRGLVI